jgi:hypothetical protein
MPSGACLMRCPAQPRLVFRPGCIFHLISFTAGRQARGAGELSHVTGQEEIHELYGAPTPNDDEPPSLTLGSNHVDLHSI